MKKCIYLLGAALLGLASCSQEEFQPVEGDGNVHLTVKLPSSQFTTRAFSDGYSALNLDYAVYDAATDKLVTTGNTSFTSTSLQTTVDLQLANGRSYKVAFFASNNTNGGANNVYTFDAANKSVSVDYGKMTDYNSTDYDCFYALDEVPKVTGPVNRNVILTRPMAQINWGTDDLANYAVVAEDAYGAGAANLVSSVTVKNVHSAFGLLDGKVTEATTDVTFIAKARPNGETFPVSKGQGVTPDYEYLSMQYVLVDAGENANDNSIVEATLTPGNKSGFTGESVVVANLPIQRNYRTNIYGSLLTSPADFKVIKEPDYNTPDYNHYITKPASSFGTETLDPSKSYKFEGAVDQDGKPTEKINITAANGNVKAAGIAFENVELAMPYPMTVEADRFELKNVIVSGSKATDANANPTINVKNVSAIDVDGVEFNRANSYNGLEIGLSQTSSDLKVVNVKNITWTNANHNAVSIYTLADNAVINIEGSTFDNSKGGVPIRLSNQTSAKNVTVNIKDCNRTSWTVASKGRCDDAILWIQDITTFNAMTTAGAEAGYFEANNPYTTWTINLENVKVDDTLIDTNTNTWTKQKEGNQISIGGFATHNIGSKKVDNTEWKANQHCIKEENAILLEGFGMDLVTNPDLFPKVVVK